MSLKITHNKVALTKAEQKKVVNHVFSMVKSGTSITKARKTVADEIGVSPNTLWVWQDKLGMTTPNIIKATNLVKNNGSIRKSTRVVTKSSTGAIKGLENMKGQLGVVFTSLVNQDGRFSNQDATAISGTANVILGCCKQVLLERKAITKVAKTEHLL